MTSPKPSPPSLIGSSRKRSPGRTLRHPAAIALAAPWAERVPLNLSGQIRMLCKVLMLQGLQTHGLKSNLKVVETVAE